MAESFRTRIRRVTDKRTGNQVVVHDFAPRRSQSVSKFMRYARSCADEHKNGMTAFFICAFDNELLPTTASFVEAHVPLSDAILTAAITEAFRFRVAREQTKEMIEDPPPCG